MILGQDVTVIEADAPAGGRTKFETYLHLYNGLKLNFWKFHLKKGNPGTQPRFFGGMDTFLESQNVHFLV